MSGRSYVKIAYFLLAAFISNAQSAQLSYVVTQESDSPLHIHDVSLNGSPVNTLPVGTYNKDVAISGDGKVVYVVQSPLNANSTFSKIDATTNKVVKTYKNDVNGVSYVGINSLNIETNADGSVVYVDSESGIHRFEISSTNHEIVQSKTITPKFKKSVLDQIASGKYLIATGFDFVSAKNGISIIDTVSFSVVTEIEIGGTALGVTTDSNATTLFVASQTEERIYRILLNASPITLTDFIVLTAQGTSICGPVDVTYDNDFNRLYVACSGFNKDVRQEENFQNVSGNDGGLLTVDLGFNSQKFEKLSLPENFYSSNVGYNHLGSIQYDTTDRKIIVIKNKWGSPAGTFASIVYSGNNGLYINGEIEYHIADRTNYYSVGNFVGPDCKECPGAALDYSGSTKRRRASMSPWHLAVLAAVITPFYISRKKKTLWKSS